MSQQQGGRHVAFSVMLRQRAIPYLELPQPTSLAAIRIVDPKFYIASNADTFATPPLRGV